MVMTNPQAVRLLEGTEQSTLWEMASRNASDWNVDGQVVALAHQEARVRCPPVTDGLQVFAYVLEFDVIAERVHKPTWRSQPGRFMRNLVGRSSGWLRVDHLARNASTSTVPLLVRGRSGVGKFAVVKEIHADTDRWGPMTVIDASLLPVHGVSRWMGRVEAALQMPRGVVVITHLERVGEAGDVLAGLLEHHADTRCRIVTTLTDGATGADQVNQGLLDRVGRLTITVPTLRDRYEDLPDLVGHITRQASGRSDPPHWTSNALQALGRLEWPGNVRELDNVVRSVVMARPTGAISATDLPDEVRARAHRFSLTQMERAEADAIVAALIEASGNKAEAATALGISRSTLYRKLRAYGLDLDRLTY
jgi:DNA-binding NtrC family response regulator